MATVFALTPSHRAVLALFNRLPADVEIDAEVVADLLSIPEVEAARLLDDLETAGCVASALGRVQ